MRHCTTRASDDKEQGAACLERCWAHHLFSVTIRGWQMKQTSGGILPEVVSAWQTICKPGSVGLLSQSGRSFLYEYGHPYSLAAYPRCLDRGGRLSPHIWPCSSRGLPCRSCCHERGGLLPHRFTLATRVAVYFLWHFPSRATRAARAQGLPGGLSTGARTFLELVPQGYQRATVRSFACSNITN
jgi:hypothetical protein